MGNLRMRADQISFGGGKHPMSVETAIKNAGNVGLAHTTDIAPDFSTEVAYSAGDMVYYNGSLYEFTEDHAAGAWSSEDTQPVTVEEAIKNAGGSVSAWATTETVAGTWNGKTLYRRLFTFQTHGDEWNTTLDADTPVDFAVMEFGYIYAETGGEKRYININTYQGSVWAFGYAGVQDDRIHFYDRRNGNLLADKYATVSILYTKKEA